MKFKNLELQGVFTIEPLVFKDDRGEFFESFNHNLFCEFLGKEIFFVQDNHSISKKNVLRGIHYQINPMAQGKLVRVIDGEIDDYAVDLRKNSDTFGDYVKVKLSSKNKKQLWIPEGFGHAFLTISDSAQVVYKTTNFYSKEFDRSIRWDDSTLGIKWNISNPIISAKDEAGLPLNKADLF